MDTRPTQVFDPMLQHERTALAWERTAIASMVAGTLLARQAAALGGPLGALGVLQVAFGAALLVWTGMRYEQLHAPLRRGENPAHPRAVRFIGATTVFFTGAATAVAIAATVA